MKNHILRSILVVLFFMLISVMTSYAQTTVTIGTGTTSTSYLPVNRYYNYSVWEGIYLSSEIGTSGVISSIKFYKNSTDDGSNVSALKVYMKQTTETSLGDGTWATTGYTLVFDGTMTNSSAAGWKTITLGTTFLYDNTSNLEILVVHDYQAYTSNYPIWRYSTTSPAKSRYYASDNNLPPTLLYTTGRANIQIDFNCAAPSANAGNEQSICIGDSVTIGGSPAASGGSGSGYTYSWSPTTGLSSSTVANPKASPSTTTTYTLTVTDGASCLSIPRSMMLYVNSSSSVYAPSANKTYYASGGNFYDSGSSGSAYSNNEDYTVTFYPCSAACNKLQFVFSSFALESQANCNNDYLKIYNGPNTSATLMGTYCGSTSPGTVTSTHSTGAITFVFHSNSGTTAAGWNAGINLITSSPTANAGTDKAICNGNNTSIGGSPAASGGSGSGYTYVWSPSTGLNSTTTANPTATPTTTTAYTLTVTDGAGCVSTGSTMNVRVSSTDANTEYRVNGNLTLNVNAGKLYDSGGPSSSYAFDENYTVTLNPCVSGKHVKLNFTAFDLESSTGCAYDYIKIYDGPTTGAALLGTWCGTTSPGAITSTHSSGSLTLVFYSDYSVTGAGFTADISNVCYGMTVNAGTEKNICNGGSAVIGGSPIVTGGSSPYTYAWSPSTGLNNTNTANPAANPTTSTTYTVSVTDNQSCTATASVLVHVNTGVTDAYYGNTNKTIYASSGKFYDSGGSGSSYAYNEHYTVTFNPCDTNHVLKFTFSGFDTEEAPNGCYDYLKIYNGPTTSSPLLATVCGYGIPGPYTSTHQSGALTFEFVSDAIVTYTGWAADFTSICKRIPVADAGTDKGICPGANTSIGGTPTGSGGTGGNYTYLWSPAAGLSSATAANPSSTPSASTTYTLTVTDAVGCVSTADQVQVNISGATSEYRVNSNTTYYVAGGKIYDSGGQNSPYSYNQDYTVTLYPCERGKSVKLTFTDFDLEGNALCSYDYLEFHNGPSASSPLIGKYCGTGTLGPFTSTDISGAITLVWHSDVSVTGRGFAADISNVCASLLANAGSDKILCESTITALGGNQTASNGVAPYTYVWSPSTGLSDMNAANPIATISGNASYQVMITDSVGCTATDTIIIIISNDTAATYLSNANKEIHTNGGRFYDSGGSGSAYQFNQDYTTTFYPCAIIGGKVNIQFNSFDLETSSTCAYDWMKIYNGSDVNSPLLGTWCGTNSPGTINATNASGTLTVVFHSDYSVTGNGWDATIKVYNPIAEAGNDTSICNGVNTSIGGSPTARGGMVPYTYLWTPSTGLSATNIANPVATPSITTKYHLVVTDNAGNTVSDSVTVYVSGDSAIYATNKDMTFYVSGGKFYDSGGKDENYSNNEDYTVTFYPCDNTKKIKIDITGFLLQVYGPNTDWLKVYNGPNDSSPLIATLYETYGTGTFASTDVTGALTFKFHSNSSNIAPGWIADIYQIEKCNSLAGVTVLSDYGDGCNSDSTELFFNSQTSSFINWQYSFDNILFQNWTGSNENPKQLFLNTSIYLRAKVVLDDGDTCFSNIVKYSAGNNYYVNDNSTQGDVWCTGVGLSTNEGHTPSTPLNSIQDVIDNYILGPCDTIYIDNGTYNGTITLNQNDAGSINGNIVITGVNSDVSKITTNDTNNIEITTADYIKIQNLGSNPKNGLTNNLFINHSSNIIVDNCKFISDGLKCINIDGGYSILNKPSKYIKISNCLILNVQDYGNALTLRGNCSNTIIEKNDIESNGLYNSNAIKLISEIDGGISYASDDFILRNNKIKSINYGIIIDGAAANFSNLEIFKNTITISSKTVSDGSAIFIDGITYTGDKQNKIYCNKIKGGKNGIIINDKVTNLVIYDNYIATSEIGLLVSDINGTDKKLYFNSFFNDKASVFYSVAGSNTSWKLKNNIFSIKNMTSDAIALDVTGNGLFSEIDYNLYYAPFGANIVKFNSVLPKLSEWQVTAHQVGSNGDTYSLEGFPNFINPLTADLTLGEESPAYLAGTPITGITYDYDLFPLMSIPSIGGSIGRVYMPEDKLALLNKKLDGGYHKVTYGVLKFKYIEEYKVETNAVLQCKFIDLNPGTSGNLISANLDGVNGDTYGENWYSFDFRSNSGFSVGKYYLMEITTPKNESYYLRFKFENNTPIINPPNIPIE